MRDQVCNSGDNPAGDTIGTQPPQPTPAPSTADSAGQPREIGGPKGLEPTRYGDWERNGRCYDF